MRITGLHLWRDMKEFCGAEIPGVDGGVASSK